MPKETFNDVAGMDNHLHVKWGHWGTVEVGTETEKGFPYPFARPEDKPEIIHGWWLSLSKPELKRLIKVLQKAYRQYDDAGDLSSVRYFR